MWTWKSHPIFKGSRGISIPFHTPFSRDKRFIHSAASSFNSDVKASIDRGLASFLDQYLQRRIDESKYDLLWDEQVPNFSARRIFKISSKNHTAKMSYIIINVTHGDNRHFWDIFGRGQINPSYLFFYKFMAASATVCDRWHVWTAYIKIIHSIVPSWKAKSYIHLLTTWWFDWNFFYYYILSYLIIKYHIQVTWFLKINTKNSCICLELRIWL
jgi:hypothetical protein